VNPLFGSKSVSDNYSRPWLGFPCLNWLYDKQNSNRRSILNYNKIIFICQWRL